MEPFVYDIVIANGDVISFERSTILSGYNIGISNGIIKELSPNKLSGHTVIDAKGKIVSPGFIDFHSHVDGKPFSAEVVLRQGATTTIGGERNYEGQIIRNIVENGFLINHGFHISHSFTLRRAVGIENPYVAATAKEIDAMITLAEQFLQNGVFGIHFGLEFVPGTSEDEIIELSRIAKAYDRVILIHLRRDGAESLNYFDEVVNVVKKTGVSAHIEHLMYMAGFKGVMEKMLEKIENAQSAGYDITADTGLYAAFPSCIGSSILDGNWADKYGKGVSEENIIISSGIYTGKKCDPEMYHYLRDELPKTLVTVFVLDEDEIDKAIEKPYVYISTNGADGPHYPGIGHPETAGTFPRLIKKYVREKGTLPLIEAIKKVSLLPAQRFGIDKRGEIREGYMADIVIFDYNTIADRSNYVNVGDPNMPPEGIEYVIINGEVILKNGTVFQMKNPGKWITHV
jgi:N-acyl-D-amino-acid deacylase